jgi:hypothetical protein
MAMSHVSGKHGVERKAAWGEGCVSQYDAVGLGMGRICWDSDVWD